VSAFAVNGSNLPNITWDVGESYAGLLPITDNKGEKRKLFFWYFTSHNSEPKDEIVVWRAYTTCIHVSTVLTSSPQ
jgi:carboxypeptidase D